METQHNKHVKKTNRLAVFSLVTGILSLLSYLPFIISILLFIVTGIRDQISFPYVLNVFSGSILGLIGLTVSNIAIGQIKKSEGVEIDHRYAVIGKALSILGILVNIIFCLFSYFVAFFFD